VLESLPQVLQFAPWRESRSEGFVGQPNEYAALLSTIAPFVFLFVFLIKKRPVLRILALGLLCCMAASVISTYSRAGYLAFAIALAGTAFLVYRSTGRVPLGIPALVTCGVCLLPIVAVPELLDTVKKRFEVKTYLRARRKSYTAFGAIDRFSGGRLEFWKSALRMAEANPILGVGFHAFQNELPKYHPRKEVNYPHNQYLGALAEGGILWLSVLLVMFWKFLRFFYQSWRTAISDGDETGQVVCGGALVAFVIMLWICCTNDFFDPGPKNVIFWVVMAGAVRYAMLPAENEAEQEHAGR
jgi:O-antigen ligase